MKDTVRIIGSRLNMGFKSAEIFCELEKLELSEIVLFVVVGVMELITVLNVKRPTANITNTATTENIPSESVYLNFIIPHQSWANLPSVIIFIMCVTSLLFFNSFKDLNVKPMFKKDFL